MSFFIGIDIGASFIKGALFNLDQLTIKNIKKYPSPKLTRLTREKYSNSQKPLRFEIKTELYLQKVKKLINEYIKIAHKIEGIVFSSQMHGMLLVNPLLEPLTPFIGWQDERLLETAPKQSKTWLDLLREKLANIDLSSTGIGLRSGLMGATLFWLKEHKLLEQNPNSQASFLGDYIAAKLTGGPLLVEPTHACGSGLFDVRRRQWSLKILKRLQIRVSHLPKVVRTGTLIGHYQYKSLKIPIYVSTGDLQTAITGSLVGLSKKREISINIGTGSQVSIVARNFIIGDYEIRSYFDNRYLYTITHLPAGRALNVIINFIANIGKRFYNRNQKAEIWKGLFTSLLGKKSSEGLKCRLSFFKNNALGKDTGYWKNVSEQNWTVENMFFSALENMAENYWWAFKRLTKEEKIEKIICSGGLIRKLKPLQELLSKRFKKEVSLAPFKEETLAGLFILSLVCRKDFNNLDSASQFVKKHNLSFS